MTDRVRCRHGFPSEICPSCQEEATPPHFNFGRSEPDGGTRPLGTPFIAERRAQEAKALAVVEAARRLFEPASEAAQWDMNTLNDESEALYDALGAALAAFDEVEGS